MQKTPPRTKSQSSTLSTGLICALICAVLVGLSYFLNNTENAIYQASMKPIPTGTPDDPNPNAPVTCNGIPMSLTDKCQHTLIVNGNAGLPADFTYEQQKQYQQELRKENVVTQREQLALQQHNQPRPFGGLLGCVSFPLFLAGVFAGILALVVFWQWFAQLLKRKRA